MLEVDFTNQIRFKRVCVLKPNPGLTYLYRKRSPKVLRTHQFLSFQGFPPLIIIVNAILILKPHMTLLVSSVQVHMTLLVTSVQVLFLLMPMSNPCRTTSFCAMSHFLAFLQALIQEKKLNNHISTQVLCFCSMPQTIHEIFTILSYFFSSKRMFLFWIKCKGFFPLVRLTLAFSILWHPPFADLAHGD